MTDTTTQPRAGEVPTSEDFPAHIFCHLCYPGDPYPGIRAICGVELLGIDAHPDDPTCVPCDREAARHIVAHARALRGG